MDMMTMTTPSGFPSRYASRCPACSGQISIGQLIRKGGSGYQHVDCSATAAAPAAQTAPIGPRAITVERVGRRSYLRGDTLAVRGLLRDGGCHWDADARAWWIGSPTEAEALAERARTATAEAAPKKRITHCLGCGGALDHFQQQRGFKFCSSDCVADRKLGGQSGYIGGRWHQGSDD